MKVYNLEDFFRGWFIGNFEPTLLKTPDFEVGLLTHSKGEFWHPHVHKIADEYNLLIEGRMEICGQTIEKGQVFVIEKNTVADPVFLEDCKVLVVKVPSVPGDKYNVTKEEK